VGVRILLAC